MKNVACALAFLVMVALSGCGRGGPTMYKITGTLTKGGVPMIVGKKTLVNLIFAPQEEGSKSTYPAKRNPEEGTYEVQVPAGKYKINLLMTDYEEDHPIPFVRHGLNNTVYDVTGDKVIDIDISN